jgi:hypothetical protein
MDPVSAVQLVWERFPYCVAIAALLGLLGLLVWDARRRTPWGL